MSEEGASPERDPTPNAEPTRAPQGSNATRTALAIAVPIVIVVAVVVGMAWSIVYGFRFTASVQSRPNVAYWEIDSDYYSCLAAQVKSVVPPNDVVWVSNTTPESPFWYRTLWKVAAAYRPVTLDTSHVIDLYLVTVPEGQGCLGTHVKAVFPDGVVRYGKGSIPQADWVRWETTRHPSTP
jgi:uncharacterized iron-regulated membrane protein